MTLKVSEPYSPKITPSLATTHSKDWYTWMKVKSSKLFDSNWLSSKNKPLIKLGQLVSQENKAQKQNANAKDKINIK